jgi:hypothetical protein
LPFTQQAPQYQPGAFSQQAFQMAGSPHYGPFQSMDAPSMPAGAPAPGGGTDWSKLIPLLGLGLLGNGGGGGGGNNNSKLLQTAYGKLKDYFTGTPSGGGGPLIGSGGDFGVPSTAADIANGVSIGGITDPAMAAYIGGLGTGADAAGAAAAADLAGAQLSPEVAATLDGLGAGTADAAGTAAAADAAGTGSGAAAGGAAGGWGAGAFGAIAAPLAVAAYGASTPAVELTGKYWNNINNSIAAGPGTTMQSKIDYTNALNAVMTNSGMGAYGLGGGIGQGSNGISGQATPAEWQQLAQYGITPQNIQQISAKTENPQMFDYMQANPSLFNWGPIKPGATGGGGAVGARSRTSL